MGSAIDGVCSKMTWNLEELSQFFGAAPEVSMIEDRELVQFDYRSQLLRYCLIIEPDPGRAAISANTTNPFGGDSLYEFYVACDQIWLESSDFGPVLTFGRGTGRDYASWTMTVRKRDDGELVVWPRDFRVR